MYRQFISIAGAGLAATVALSAALPAQAAGFDHRPVRQGSRWLAHQLTDGLVHNDQYAFDDYGLTIDTALALRDVDRRRADVRTARRAVAAGIESYIGTGPEQYANATAKALIFAVRTGASPRHFGGVDLVSRMVSLTADNGRIADHSAYGDYANVLGQAYAANGLTATHSQRARKATRFLLKQQCRAGFFRLYFAPVGSPQTCDDGRSAGLSTPDTDATAIAVQMLLSQRARPSVHRALHRAERWLLRHQRHNGSFIGGASTDSPNSNSSGLAGTALGLLGDAAAAGRSAFWVRRQQVHEAGACTTALRSQRGAIAYDPAAYRAAQGAGLGSADFDQWRRATAQAMPVLRWAPRAEGALTLVRTAKVQGAVARLVVRGVAPGDTVCVTGAGNEVARNANRHGVAHVPVRIPSGFDHARFSVVDSAGRTYVHVVRQR
jgi:hypothetical protein